MVDTNVLAYIGGIIDGEGCLFISKRGQSLIFVESTSEELIIYLNKNFLGSISHIPPRTEKNLPKYKWTVYGLFRIRDFLENIIPYLIIKKEQAELLLEFVQSRIKTIPQNKTYSERENFIQREVKKLKKEYPPNLPQYKFNGEEKEYYLAGLVDREGTIRIAKSEHKYANGNIKLNLNPRLSIINTDKRMTEFLLKEFGGFIRLIEREHPQRDVYQWDIQGNKIEIFLKLKDKLIIKKQQLDLIIEYIKLKEYNHFKTERGVDIYLELLKLNKKGKRIYNREYLLELIKPKTRRLFATKEELYDLYWLRCKSLHKIAVIYDVSDSAIHRNMKKLNIPLRPPNGYKNKDIKGELSTYEE